MKQSHRICAAVIALAAASRIFAAPWTFAFFCDCRNSIGEPGGRDGVNVVAVHAIASDIASMKPDLVVFPGDLVNGDSRYGPLPRQFATWKEAMAPILSSGIPVYMCRGNHDTKQDSPKGASVEAWRGAFPDLPRNGPPGQEGLSYYVSHKNAEFIATEQFLGQSGGYKGDGHGNVNSSGMISPWVIDRVKTSPARWVFVFGHETAFIGHHTDCLASCPAERDALWDALGARGGVYLAGHDHMYVRHTAPDSAGRPVLELVVGCGGATPYSYDHFSMNASQDRHVMPNDLFVNARPGGKPNTGGLPMYLGYLLVKVDGDSLVGVWRAFTNYNTRTMTGPAEPEKPRFEALDAFGWPDS